MLEVSIQYRGTASLQKRIDSALALRKLINALKETYAVELKRIDDISCTFLLGGEGATEEKLREVVAAHLAANEYEVTVKVAEAAREAGGGDARADKGSDKAAGRSRTGGLSGAIDLGGAASTRTTGVSSADSLLTGAIGLGEENRNQTPGGVDAVMQEIHALIGAEEFKQKAEELVRIAPRLREIDGYFVKNRFLFSVDDGGGLSVTTALFARLLVALGLSKTDDVTELPPVPSSDDPERFEMMIGEYLKAANRHGLLVVDLSKCYGGLAKENYREFLTKLGMLPKKPILIFRIPYLDDQVSRSVVDALSDQFFLHHIPFVPASMDELYVYATRAAEAQGYTFSDDMRAPFDSRLAREKSDGRFYGFRTIDKIVYELIYEKVKNDTAGDKVISSADVTFGNDNIYSEDGTGMEQLEALTGMDSVVKQIKDLLSYMEYGSQNPKDRACFHLRFIGNPGTGKTTVARILGKLLKERGILRTGVFFEYSGNDFIAQYVGHTAPKTAQMCRDAYGGILFIDEAYALSPGAGDSGSDTYRREAINTLITEMENHRKDMIVIMAGYKDEIDELMQHNPGLEQRMPYTIEFENFSREALADIFLSMASKRFHYEPAFDTAVREYFARLPHTIYHSETFSNARYVRNLYERTVSKAVLRAQLEKTKVATLTPVDLQKAAEEIERTATASPRMAKNKSGATMFHEERAKVKFKDVCGQDGAKALLMELVDCLKHPDKYARLNVRVPKGALLYGPPGTGKTLLAKAVAGEAGVPVLTISGSDLIGKYVADGAERVKALFEKARAVAPSIVFIDEIDAIGTSRSGGGSSALLQLLTEMDGFEENGKTVIVLAATNRPDDLDPALRRPGRFDRDIPVELPELDGRIAILAHHLEKRAHEACIDLKEVATMTRGFSGAELANTVNEAAFRVIRDGREVITTKDLLDSAEAIRIGNVKEGITISDHEKWVICYHEIGHALTTALLTSKVTIKKITVVPRTGGVLGFASHADSAPSFISTKSDLENEIAGLVGGRAAEEVHFGESSTGASNDIMVATRIARSMVATYGMSDRFDMVGFDVSTGGYLGGGTKQICSDATAQEIDQAVVDIVRTQHERVIKLLREHVELLDELAAHIFEQENISGEEFMDILRRRGVKV